MKKYSYSCYILNMVENNNKLLDSNKIYFDLLFYWIKLSIK